jgi:hypothetical protein
LLLDSGGNTLTRSELIIGTTSGGRSGESRGIQGAKAQADIRKITAILWKKSAKADHDLVKTFFDSFAVYLFFWEMPQYFANLANGKFGFFGDKLSVY